MGWFKNIDESRVDSMFQKLANELKDKELKDSTKEFSSDELNELGLKLTTQWQEENKEDLEEKLVSLHGTDEDKAEYQAWKLENL